MILTPEKMDFSKQTFSAIIYGSPGIGKTTLACSAPKPLLIDFDRGVSRVRADHRVTTVVADTYEEVWNDLQDPMMKEFETIIIDTGGSFVTFLKDWAFRTKPGAKTKAGEFSSLKGFGFVKTEFQNFTNHVKTVMNKNIIYVFHAEEKADKDGNPVQRLLCEGSAVKALPGTPYGTPATLAAICRCWAPSGRSASLRSRNTSQRVRTVSTERLRSPSWTTSTRTRS